MSPFLLIKCRILCIQLLVSVTHRIIVSLLVLENETWPCTAELWSPLQRHLTVIRPTVPISITVDCTHYICCQNLRRGDAIVRY